MKKIKLYIAISLDGKIADANGSTDWLEQIPNPDQNDYGYFDLLNAVDVTLMGNSTYQQVRSFPIPFPYADKENYVFTRNGNLKKDEYATFVSANFKETLMDLKNKEGKDIWLIGGGEVNTLLQSMDLIDEYLVFVMPIILGEGTPLFAAHPKKSDLKLITSKTFESGAVLLHYTKG